MAATLSMSYASSPNLNNTVDHFINKRKCTSKSLNFGFITESNWGISVKEKISCITSKQRRRNHKLGSLVVSSASALASMASTSSLEFDVVVVGAGVIGLTIARQFLNESDSISVAVVDAFVPCSHGATGAGQGYLWMVHKAPGSEKWELAKRSKKLWEMLAQSIEDQGSDPLDLLGWKKTGSLLVGRTQEDASGLEERVKLLSEAGLRAEYLSSADLRLKEPSLEIEKEGGAAFLPDDCQLDARRTVAFLEKENRQFASKGRYAEFYNEPALQLIRSDNTGEVEAVQTSKNRLYCKKAVVIAAGSWSGSLMKSLLKESNIVIDVPVKPRKGHLLVIENFKAMQLNHGLMEVGYINHQSVAHSTSSASAVPDDARTLSVSMAATTDSVGNLVLGSSREFAGFNWEIDDSIIDQIWARAGDFFPSLREVTLADLTKNRKVRVGHRPYMPGGIPMIGPVPGLPKLVLAAGHEGEGLSMALGTAEMVADMVLGNTGKVDFTPYSVPGR
ncbi:hypothetical protein MKW94_007787 [Papaver nudicaule]|uniref:FAD-dependent oxidoreductase domain-containing protein 1 n=1 Tax=Papaver nudicaule TaxID=74823 RepID=A0AA41VQD4_PAPNU|nr:hypothetical protein [Papaver nudicaule]